MDSQLKELIETIKADGVKTAEKQAEQIIAAAEEKARHIISQAQKNAEQTAENARKERDRQEAAGTEAVRQAARDLILGVQTQLVAIFKSVVEQNTGEAFSGKVLEDAIVTVVTNWAQGRSDGVQVLLAQADRDALESSLRSKLAESIAGGAEVAATTAVKSGFRVSTRDGSVYYDFSATAVADALSAYLSPRLAQAVREASQGA